MLILEVNNNSLLNPQILRIYIYPTKRKIRFTSNQHSRKFTNEPEKKFKSSRLQSIN